MRFESLLPSRPQREPGENYHVWVPGVYRDQIDETLDALIDEATSDAVPFTPDDLADELHRARAFLARTPNDRPGLLLYPDAPRFQPTHVLPGRLFHVWYLIWEADEFVAICRLDPNEGRSHFV